MINQKQFDFRIKLSTVHQAIRIVNPLQNNKVYRRNTSYAKQYELKLFESLDCPFIVSIDENNSTGVAAGVPEGSVISPLLYFPNTSEYILKNQHTALYTDDTAIITKGKLSPAFIKYMKKALEHANNYFSKRNIP